MVSWLLQRWVIGLFQLFEEFEWLSLSFSSAFEYGFYYVHGNTRAFESPSPVGFTRNFEGVDQFEKGFVFVHHIPYALVLSKFAKNSRKVFRVTLLSSKRNSRRAENFEKEF